MKGTVSIFVLFMMLGLLSCAQEDDFAKPRTGFSSQPQGSRGESLDINQATGGGRSINEDIPADTGATTGLADTADGTEDGSDDGAETDGQGSADTSDGTGNDDAGNDDSGNDDSGSDDSGSDDAGNDSGSDDAGNDSGTTDGDDPPPNPDGLPNRTNLRYFVAATVSGPLDPDMIYYDPDDATQRPARTHCTTVLRLKCQWHAVAFTILEPGSQGPYEPQCVCGPLGTEPFDPNDDPFGLFPP